MSRKTATFKFKPFSRKQQKIITWWTPESPVRDYDGIIADGAIRSGKTLSMSLSFVLWGMNSFDGENFAMCGKTVGSFRRNVLRWLKIMLAGRGYHCEDKRSENLFIVSKGDRENYFYIFGGKDESSQDLIQGITLAGVFLDEVALMPESFVNQATGRCSVDGSKLWFNCNPENPAHWFKTEWIDKAREKGLLYLHFTMDDNLSLSERVKERYRRMYTGVWYERFILGLWVLAEGLIYPMYREAIGEPPEDQRPIDYCLSIDYGTQNAFAALLWAKYGTIWYAIREYYYSGRETGVQKTDEQYSVDMDAFLSDIKQGQQLQVIIDPSAASFIAVLRQRHGGNRYKVIPADNDVLDGIRDTASALQLGIIKISAKCKRWAEEAGGYVWDDNQSEDRPVKEKDHCLTGETLVETTNGSIPISELVGKIGYVHCFDEKSGKPIISTFHDVRQTGIEEIFEICLEDGRTLKCSGEHPVLTQRGWVQADALTDGDEIINIRL